MSPKDNYFPEDERSSMDWEDDHSMTDHDLEAELEAKLGAAQPLPAPSATREGSPSVPDEHAHPAHPAHPEDGYYPEDERSSMDWEDDHSMPHHEPEPSSVLKSSAAAAGQAVLPQAGADDWHHEDDDRSHMEWDEDDHSMTDHDLEAELEAKLGAARPLPAPSAPEPAPPPAPDHHEHPEGHYYPEDERSSMDWEDDHSVPDHDARAAHHSGKQGGEPQASPFPENAGDPDRDMHPGLAASFAAFQAHAADGNGQESPDGESLKNPENGEAPAGGPTSEKGCAPDDAPDRPDNGTDDAPDGDKDEDSENASAAVQKSGEGSANAPAGTESAESDGQPSAPAETAAALAVAAGAAPPAPPAGNDGKGGEEDKEEGETNDADAEERGDRPMTLRDHLVELRRRMARAFLAVVLGFCACYPFAEQIFNFLLAPLQKAMPPDSRFIFTSPPEAFFTYMKAAFVVGIFVSCPLIFYQLWAFIAPGLYKEEKVYVLPVAFFSALFFISGGAFCYFVAFPFAFQFFMSYYTANILPMPKMDESFSFVLQLLLAFGLVFELPLFVFFLSRLGLVTAAWLRKIRRYAILVNVIVAAVLTPPDVMSQMLMAGPLLLLYEISILIAAVFGKKKPEPDPEEDDEEDDEDEDDDDEEEDDEEDAAKERAKA